MRGLNPKHVFRGVAGVCVVLASWAATFGLTYLLTAQLFAYIHFEPEPLWRQVLNSIVGLFLLGLIGGVLSRVFRRTGWSQQMRLLQPLLTAMAQIARGNFNVRVEPPDTRVRERADDPITQLFVGVNQMARELNQMETLRQEFVSNVSHEIQSPLTSIRGFARALRDEALDPAARTHYLDIIETESVRLSKLSDNLLALTSLENGAVPFDPKPFRLDLQVKNAILASEPQWAAKRIDIGIDIDPSCEGAIITASEGLLSQVWTNLIHNAVKFTPEGGRIGVTLRRRAGANRIEVAIADSGPGIRAEDQPRIFERFFKADPSRNRAQGGNGLGLAIVQKVVTLHGGGVTVRSQPGAGATFVVTLPLAPAG